MSRKIIRAMITVGFFAFEGYDDLGEEVWRPLRGRVWSSVDYGARRLDAGMVPGFAKAIGTSVAASIRNTIEEDSEEATLFRRQVSDYVDEERD